MLAYGGDDLDTLSAWLLRRQALLPVAGAPVNVFDAGCAAYPPQREPQQSARARGFVTPIRHSCAHLEFHLDPTKTMHELQLPVGRRLRASLGSLAPVPPLLLFAPQLAAAFHAQTVVAVATAAEADAPLTLMDGRWTVPSKHPSEWGDVWDDEYLAESAGPLRGSHR